MHQEERAHHGDCQAGENLQGGRAVPEVVRGNYLIVPLIHMLLASRSIVHVQIISQFCRKKGKNFNTGLPTASGLHSSRPKRLSALLGWPSFDFFLSLKVRAPGDGKKTGVLWAGPARGRWLVVLLPEIPPTGRELAAPLPPLAPPTAQSAHWPFPHLPPGKAMLEGHFHQISQVSKRKVPCG